MRLGIIHGSQGNYHIFLPLMDLRGVSSLTPGADSHVPIKEEYVHILENRRTGAVGHLGICDPAAFTQKKSVCIDALAEDFFAQLQVSSCAPCLNLATYDLQSGTRLSAYTDKNIARNFPRREHYFSMRDWWMLPMLLLLQKPERLPERRIQKGDCAHLVPVPDRRVRNIPRELGLLSIETPNVFSFVIHDRIYRVCIVLMNGDRRNPMRWYISLYPPDLWFPGMRVFARNLEGY